MKELFPEVFFLFLSDKTEQNKNPKGVAEQVPSREILLQGHPYD